MTTLETSWRVTVMRSHELVEVGMTFKVASMDSNVACFGTGRIGK
jgi:hypothetical protein